MNDLLTEAVVALLVFSALLVALLLLRRRRGDRTPDPRPAPVPTGADHIAPPSSTTR
jgi:hypothetical protein